MKLQAGGTNSGYASGPADLGKVGLPRHRSVHGLRAEAEIGAEEQGLEQEIKLEREGAVDLPLAA